MTAGSSLRLPARPEEITAEWLTSALSQTVPGAAVLDFEQDEAWYGTATKLKLRVELNDTARNAGIPASIVVKGRFAPELQITESLYEAEVKFYRDLAPKLGLNVPLCLFAGSDPLRGQHIVILEDLACRGATFCRVHNPLTFAQASSFLDNMARLHAAYWNSPEFEPGGSLQDIPFWDAVSPGAGGDHARRQLQPDAWEQHMNLPRGIGLPQRFRDRDWMIRALDALNAFGRRGDFTLLHADHHLGNLYLDGQGRAGVLDWQSPAKGAWSHDLTYFLVSALDIEDRRNWDRALVGHYINRLRDCGVVRPPSLDEAMEAFRIQIVDGLFYWAVNPVEWQEELNNCAVAPRFAIAALDHDTAGAVEAELKTAG
ncbi:phosphotransferase [Novosphingobium malaysiense]|uniref:Aminoglycoside phosphotransferase domain-containing protein n=1 Tax=Novosphingobium malaysiense TaxID=1348853 RepID=A0A0B1ZF59_9SPHN|nr:phosphotransferase [Novosphingobium malaysiense]KHK89105.1 hypothetical protein LK12_22535 [Novosphingobium malaysiense]